MQHVLLRHHAKGLPFNVDVRTKEVEAAIDSVTRVGELLSGQRIEGVMTRTTMAAVARPRGYEKVSNLLMALSCDG